MNQTFPNCNIKTFNTSCQNFVFSSSPVFHSFSSFYMIQLLILGRWDGHCPVLHQALVHFGGPSHSGALSDLASNTPPSADAADRRAFKKEETPQRVLRKNGEGVCPLITIHIRPAATAHLSQSTDLVIIRRSED